MRSKMGSGPLITGLLVLVAACGAEDRLPSPGDATSSSTSIRESQRASTTAPARDLPSVETVPSDDAPVSGEVPLELLDPVLADTEIRTGIPRSQWTILRAEEVVWSDGSLGCPESPV